jgi:hypothetical protein
MHHLNGIKMETIAQEAKRLLEAIPEERWMEYNYALGACRCGMGHWNEYKTGDPWNCTFETQLNNEVRKYASAVGLQGNSVNDVTISLVNDGSIGAYPQETAKQRVMALLDDMILWEKAQKFADTMKLSKALTDDNTGND